MVTKWLLEVTKWLLGVTKGYKGLLKARNLPTRGFDSIAKGVFSTHLETKPAIIPVACFSKRGDIACTVTS